MSLRFTAGHGDDAVEIELRDPKIAVLLAWLWPGAGHFYQRRFVKGFIFMICISSLFLYGMSMGRGRVFYHSFRQNDFRWQFICQAGFGTPAILAVAQSMKVKNNRDPFLVLCERYPAGYEDAENNLREFEMIPADEREAYDGEVIRDGLMAPPKGPVILEQNDVLGMWHAEMRHFYDLGTLYTIVAGLLNLFAIYDAFAGPAIFIKPEDAEGNENEDENEDEIDR